MEIISTKSNMGEIYRDKDTVYKSVVRANGDRTIEYEALKDLAKSCGVIDVKRSGYNRPFGQDFTHIEMPYYKHIVSFDAVPKDKRMHYTNAIQTSIPTINRTINFMTVLGYNYNDMLQFAYDMNQDKMLLMDMSNSTKDKYAKEDNYSNLTQFYRLFGLDKQAEIINNGIRLMDTMNLYSTKDLEEGMCLVSEKYRNKVLLAKSIVGDMEVKNIYYSTNARYVQLKDIAQSEHENGVRYVLSERPLTLTEQYEWELKPIYQSDLNESLELEIAYEKAKSRINSNSFGNITDTEYKIFNETLDKYWEYSQNKAEIRELYESLELMTVVEDYYNLPPVECALKMVQDVLPEYKLPTIKIQDDLSLYNIGKVNGLYNSATKEISLDTSVIKDNYISVILHEIGHHVHDTQYEQKSFRLGSEGKTAYAHKNGKENFAECFESYIRKEYQRKLYKNVSNESDRHKSMNKILKGNQTVNQTKKKVKVMLR